MKQDTAAGASSAAASLNIAYNAVDQRHARLLDSEVFDLRPLFELRSVWRSKNRINVEKNMKMHFNQLCAVYEKNIPK